MSERKKQSPQDPDSARRALRVNYVDDTTDYGFVESLANDFNYAHTNGWDLSPPEPAGITQLVTLPNAPEGENQHYLDHLTILAHSFRQSSERPRVSIVYQNQGYLPNAYSIGESRRIKSHRVASVGLWYFHEERSDPELWNTRLDRMLFSMGAAPQPARLSSPPRNRT